MRKNKKTIIFLLIGIILIISVVLIISFLPKKNEQSILSLETTNQIKYKDNKIKLKENSTIEVVAKLKNNKDNIYNYGLFYKMINGNKNYISIGSNDVSDSKLTGSIKKEEITIPLKISNTSNEEVIIYIDANTSTLEIKYDEEEYQINKHYQEKSSAPNLVSGMIPIYYNETKKYWAKADYNNNDNNWYDYENKKWANVALISEQTRNKYQSEKVDTKINEEDILAYYVWIPRYDYKLFNTEFENSNEQKINIRFTLKNDEKSIGVKNDEYLTHPAFTFGDVELSGIWVSKFEVTGTQDNPTSKPNLVTLTSQTVSEQFNTAKKFASKEYIDETSINKIDSHMIKNIEWGAIAYLSHSIYGVCNEETCFEIANNNVNTSKNTNGPSITGCASIIKNANMVVSNTCDTDKTKPYNNIEYGVLASTTRSIYGIYDMNGGSWENVMTVMNYKDTKDIISGSNENMNSGFTGILYDKDTKRTSSYKGLDLPSSKYYDIYLYAENNNNNFKLGDALGETNNWYDDYNQPIIHEGSWLMRGGLYNHKEKDGIFAFARNNGKKSLLRGFRAVIINVDN